MTIDHGPLRRVQVTIVVSQILDGKQGLAMQCRQEQDAGVDGSGLDRRGG